MISRKEESYENDNSKHNTANSSQENLRDELQEGMSGSGGVNGAGGGSGPIMSSSLIGSDVGGLNSGSIIVNSQPVSINRWNTDRVLDWFSKRFPNYYESYKTHFIQNQITGSSLLEFNANCLNQMNIFDSTLREQMLEEIALLKIKNEYEFVRRFKSPSTNNSSTTPGGSSQTRD